MQNSKNNYISTAKAIGIILMVVGHSQCPTILHNIIYMFHMPLFFFCSGYFFHKSTNKKALSSFFLKKIKGLYLPYIKWSFAFLLLHNVFYLLNIYNRQYGYLGGSHLYNTNEFFNNLINIVFTMDGHEYLLGGFWFIKILFIDTTLLGFIYFFIKEEKQDINMGILLVLLVLTIILRYMHIKSFPIIGDLSLITYGGVFVIIGHIYKSLEKTKIYHKGYILSAIIVFMTSLFYYKEGLSIQCYYKNIIPYTIISSLGIYLTFSFSLFIDNFIIKKIFYNIGQSTMMILSLHFLSFKLVSISLIYLYDIPIYHLSEYPVLNISNGNYWCLYSLTGIILPLLVKYLYYNTQYRFI